MNLKKMILSSLALTITQTHGAIITNHIQGLGPANHLINPYICIQDAQSNPTYTLAPGESVDGNAYSKNPYYIGATLRFGGCDSSKSYLGYLGISTSGNIYKISAYTPPQGVHITYSDAQIDHEGNITGSIQYTPIAANFNFLSAPPAQNNTWEFVGINLSGLEFGKMVDPVVVPNLSAEDQALSSSDLKDTQNFIAAGMNTVRIPVRWSYLQLEGAGQGAIDENYFNAYVKPLLETLTLAHVYTIIDLHAYMRYSIFGEQYAGCGPDGPCPDGTLITDPSAYVDIWSKFYQLIKSDDKINVNYILLDLVNEPVLVPDDKVFTIQTALINSLQQQGFKGYILVEGNNWSGLHSWEQTWQSQDTKTNYSNATLFTAKNFAKANITDLSKIIINVHQYLDRDYSGTHDQCQKDLSTQGPDGFNLQAFVAYLQQNQLKAMITEFGAGKDTATCTPALTQFLNYLQANSSKGKNFGFIGWTIWSSGHGWGNYNLRVTPTSYQMQVLKTYLKNQRKST